MFAFSYDPAKTAPAIRAALELISEDFAIKPARGGRATLSFELSGSGPRFIDSGGHIRISGATVPQVLRALALLHGFAAGRGGVPDTYDEKPRFDTLGLMYDCSRNGVPTVATVKLFLRRIALMGMNLFMLYTEDTYEVPGEPHLGYLRGRFTQKELKELDDYAFKLGVEMMPCIQTLAHLAQPLRWFKTFGEISGTADVLRVGEPKTYARVDKWVRAASKPYRSKRIHIGMDEAALGHGKNKPKPGKTEFDLMLEHLSEVVRVVKGAGLKPMMWSDMWFTLGGGYLNTDAKVPDEVARQIPPEVQLVYWDYYKQDPAHYAKMVELHRAMGKEPIFAPGCWTDYVFWCHLSHARIDTDAGMLAMKKQGVREAFTTMWGDDGASCNFLSALPAIQHFAEHGYRDAVSSDDLRLALRGSCNIDLEAFDTGRQIDLTPNLAPTMREWAKHFDNRKEPAAVEHLLDVRGADWAGTNPGTFLTWQDPMVGIFDHHLEGLPIAAEYREVAANIGKARKAGAIEKRELAFVHALAELLEIKGDLGVRLRKAYVKRDKKALRELANRVLPEALRRAKKAHEAHRRQWFSLNKPNGWEVHDVRWSGVLGRLRSAEIRVKDYLADRVDSLPELAEERLVVSDFPKGRLGYGGPAYRKIISPSVIT